MLGSEGLLVMLHALIAKPMILALYTNHLPADSDPDGPEFMLTKNAQQRAVGKKDWTLNPDEFTATMPEHVFRFDGPAADNFGWVLLTRDERACMAWSPFKKPYPINSARDTVGVQPILRTRKAPA